MIDHITIRVGDFEKSKIFYQRALAPLGYKILTDLEFDHVSITGFGAEGRAVFWLTTDTPKSAFVHLAFGVRDRKLVDAFYEAAIAAGGRDNGRPGIRPHYHPDYYGAFVFDPDGNNIEAVCRLAEG